MANGRIPTKGCSHQIEPETAKPMRSTHRVVQIAYLWKSYFLSEELENAQPHFLENASHREEKSWMNTSRTTTLLPNWLLTWKRSLEGLKVLHTIQSCSITSKLIRRAWPAVNPTKTCNGDSGKGQHFFIGLLQVTSLKRLGICWNAAKNNGAKHIPCTRMCSRKHSWSFPPGLRSRPECIWCAYVNGWLCPWSCTWC